MTTNVRKTESTNVNRFRPSSGRYDGFAAGLIEYTLNQYALAPDIGPTRG